MLALGMSVFPPPLCALALHPKRSPIPSPTLFNRGTAKPANSMDGSGEFDRTPGTVLRLLGILATSRNYEDQLLRLRIVVESFGGDRGGSLPITLPASAADRSFSRLRVKSNSAQANARCAKRRPILSIR